MNIMRATSIWHLSLMMLLLAAPAFAQEKAAEEKTVDTSCRSGKAIWRNGRCAARPALCWHIESFPDARSLLAQAAGRRQAGPRGGVHSWRRLERRRSKGLCFSGSQPGRHRQVRGSVGRLSAFGRSEMAAADLRLQGGDPLDSRPRQGVESRCRQDRRYRRFGRRAPGHALRRYGRSEGTWRGTLANTHRKAAGSPAWSMCAGRPT